MKENKKIDNIYTAFYYHFYRIGIFHICYGGFILRPVVLYDEERTHFLICEKIQVENYDIPARTEKNK